MIKRCNNKNCPEYKHYGERGISVCKKWLNFENFLEDMGEPSTNKHSIDRIDNDKGYYKENCKWSNQKEQCRNKRNNHLITYKNQTKCISEWAEITGIKRKTIEKRIKYGWSIEKTLTKNIRKCNIIVKYNNELKSLYEWSKIFNINYNTLKKRISLNWPLNKLFNKIE